MLKGIFLLLFFYSESVCHLQRFSNFFSTTCTHPVVGQVERFEVRVRPQPPRDLLRTCVCACARACVVDRTLSESSQGVCVCAFLCCVVCVCVRARTRLCMCALPRPERLLMCVCVCVCVRARASVRALRACVRREPWARRNLPRTCMPQLIALEVDQCESSVDSQTQAHLLGTFSPQTIILGSWGEISMHSQ